MVDSAKQKDWWDKVSSFTPLILGLSATGVAALFTQIYNFQQLQLNQIVALDKLRPLLTSNRTEEETEKGSHLNTVSLTIFLSYSPPCQRWRTIWLEQKHAWVAERGSRTI
jgi:hypothetical protein